MGVAGCDQFIKIHGSSSPAWPPLWARWGRSPPPDSNKPNHWGEEKSIPFEMMRIACRIHNMSNTFATTINNYQQCLQTDQVDSILHRYFIAPQRGGIPRLHIHPIGWLLVAVLRWIAFPEGRPGRQGCPKKNNGWRPGKHKHQQLTGPQVSFWMTHGLYIYIYIYTYINIS